MVKEQKNYDADVRFVGYDLRYVEVIEEETEEEETE